jgi:sugar O-acyltransferase (sialic acid O-acetyltransferase NeuD family)
MIILGAKGLAKELLTLLSWNADTDNLYFFDNINSNVPEYLYGTFPVLKSWEALQDYFMTVSPEFALGMGGASIRMNMSEQAQTIGGQLRSIVSNHALIGEFGNSIDDGACILSHATITCDVHIGTGTLINKAAIISHDAEIGRYCEISPGAKILGRTTIEDCSEIGANAVILPDITIGKNCKIGAGAVVTQNIRDNITVAGIPAKQLL